MFRIASAAAPFLLSLCTFAQGAGANLDFEEGGTGGLPERWQLHYDEGHGNYSVRTSFGNPLRGERCAELACVRDVDDPGWFYLYQSVPAEEWIGRRMRLSAGARARLGEGGELRLYMEVLGAEGESLAHEDTRHRSIRSTRWLRYDLVVPVEPGARWINFGAILRGPGSACVDAFDLAPLEDGEDPMAGKGLFNGDFETGYRGEMPWAWSVAPSVESLGASATLVRGSAYRGRSSARLSSGSVGAGGLRSNLTQVIDARPYRDKRVRLRAAVRAAGTDDVPGRAQLWLGVEREGGKRGFAHDGADRPATSGEWEIVEIEGPVHSDAERIRVAVMGFADGEVYVDDVSVDIVGEAVAATEPPRSLSRRGATNLAAFARLFGLVRHFHPSDQAADCDWTAFAVHGVREIEAAKDGAELVAGLRTLFADIAPTVAIHVEGESPELHAALTLAEDVRMPRITAWRHVGFGQGSLIYSSRRDRERVRDGELPEGFEDPAAPLAVDLGGGARARVPLSLFRDRRGTFPQGPAVELPVDSGFLVARDRATRLAAVVMAWNVFQHFYPYFDVVEVDWRAELDRALARAAEDADGYAFEVTLQRMVAALEDGHGDVLWLEGASRLQRLPLAWAWIEDRLVVVESADEELAAGSVVLAIDGVATEEAIAAREQRESAATASLRRRRALSSLAEGTAGELRQLRVQAPDGSEQELTLALGRPRYVREEPRPANMSEVREGVMYFDVSRTDAAAWETGVEQLAAADAVIVDFRGYPHGLPLGFLGHLSDGAVRSPRWEIPAPLRPDREDLGFKELDWSVDPAEPRFGGRLVFLTDERAVSAAETCLQIVAHHELGEIVGAHTAGTNGNVNPFDLPGGYRVSWTGMRVLNQDGSRFHGVGVVPTVPASRTIAGVVEGRDEILEAALRVLDG